MFMMSFQGVIMINISVGSQFEEFGSEMLRNVQDVWKLVVVCSSVLLHVLLVDWSLN